MVAGVLKQWREDVFQAGSYQLNISGITFSHLSRIKEELKKIRGVKELQVRNFQSGHAQVDIKYEGPIEELAEKIDRLRNPSLEITGLQSNTLEMKIGK